MQSPRFNEIGGLNIRSFADYSHAVKPEPAERRKSIVRPPSTGKGAAVHYYLINSVRSRFRAQFIVELTDASLVADRQSSHFACLIISLLLAASRQRSFNAFL